MEVDFGKLCDQIYTQAETIAEANAKVKALEAEKRELETKLLDAMQASNTNIVRGKKATISISETIRPQLKDPDAFFAFVLRKKALHLFERRIAQKAYTEMKDSLKGKAVPGVDEFSQLRLNVRKV